MHVLSFSCFAPTDNPEVAVLVVLNRPEDRSVGSSAAAATAARIIEGTLSYMGVPRVLSEEDYTTITNEYWVQPAIGLTATEASARIGQVGISTVYGTPDMTGDTIIGFTYPDETATLNSYGIVMLYPETNPDGSEVQMLTTTVPNLRGKNAIECIEALRDANLNCHIEGEKTGICTVQSYEAGSTALAGTIVTVTLEATEVLPEETEDDALTGEDGVVMTEPEETDVPEDYDDTTTSEG
jgi:stage V sporulation protein D (sporulation-specific penicillin-binding protein)